MCHSPGLLLPSPGGWPAETSLGPAPGDGGGAVSQGPSEGTLFCAVQVKLQLHLALFWCASVHSLCQRTSLHFLKQQGREVGCKGAKRREKLPCALHVNLVCP